MKTFKEMLAEAKEDDGEYGQEGGMAKSQLRMIISSAKRLHSLLSDDDELPGHVIANIVLATDYITGAADYMESEMADEEDFDSEE
jgi:hypothetical protein